MPKEHILQPKRIEVIRYILEFVDNTIVRIFVGSLYKNPYSSKRS